MARITSNYKISDLAKVQAAVDAKAHGYQEMLGAGTGFELAEDGKTVKVAETWHVDADGSIWTEDARKDGVQDPMRYKKEQK